MVEGNGSNEEQYSALVVDDNACIRNVAQMLLNKCGFKTKVAEHGKDAVDICSEGNVFDAIFMDMEMPVMDGIQATKELRAMGVKSLIVGVTACESKSSLQAFVEAGLDEYFEKPLNVAKVENILKRLKK
ncbi:two-component response regulator 24 [Beta vulgaris subsp. vulgaris]|uniref:two-component response regulator 24 n=1 Tax=Beta vulgaris subsp. vulgaris TaxID=3555 RepID=UPI00203764D3|nr:two-component response regulator 24 [Beta vulgaris subsp. vulgaris]